MKLKILDLFSGLGGFSLGLERTGSFETIAFCDNDKYSKLVLQKHWKGVKIYNDVKEITKEKFIADGIQFPDIITGGFPCQPFSVAGKQAGTDDDRHLWPVMFRIIQEFTPRWVIGENVKGLTNIQDGVVFETVCSDLEGEGYEVRAFNIPAAGVGAPHRRERIWIIASLVNANSDGSSATTIGGSVEKTSNDDQEREIKTCESERTSGRKRNEDMEDSRRTLQQGTELREKNEDEVGEGYANQHQRSGSTSESNVANANNTGDRTPEHETNRDGQKTDKRWQEQSQLKSSGHSKNVANAISRDVEAGRERQRGIRTKSQGQGTSSDVTSGSETSRKENVANTEQSRSSSESIRDIGGMEEESSGEKERGDQSSIRTSTRSTDVADTYTRLSNGTYEEVQSRGQTSDTSSEGSTDVANTTSKRLEGQLRSELQGTRERFTNSSQTINRWWHTEPDVGRVAHGIPGRVYRLKGLGNSIVPKIAEEIGKAIIKAERGE